MSLVEGILNVVRNITKVITSPAVLLILMGGILVAGFGLFLWTQLKPDKKVLYVNEAEGWGQELEIDRMTPAHVYTKMKKKVAYRFIRFRQAINFQVGMKTVTRFLAKMGTAYSMKLEDGTEAGPYSLYDILVSVWDQKTVDDLKDTIKEKLILSKVPITVKLQAEGTPEGFTPKNELFIKKEANDEMARVFGENIRREMTAEDWVRTGAIFAAGIGAAYILQAMGLLAGVNV